MPQVAATPTKLTALEAAHLQFLMAVMTRPVSLGNENTIAALEGRQEDIDKHIMACRDWLAALVEDSAAHVCLPRITADQVTHRMNDAAGEVRGDMLTAIESMAEDRRPVRLVR